ncbi:MAG TPA: hypothetical protein VHQ03_02650, partial [Candidatus Dormibacteraeota bacterium]|nr:hypothetical protein [Candidatus Dormibacteraeota bacterium]
RLAHEVNYLAGVDGMAALPQHAALLALADPLALLGRILDGLHAELDPLREQLVGSLAGVLGCLDATWRTPRPREADELAFALDDALAPVYRVAEGRQAEADVKAVQEALAIALREPEIVKAIGASDDPDCARLTDWLRSVYRPAIERGDQRIRVPNSLVELRALLYRAIAAAQTASERRRADALEDELGMLKARAEVLIKSLDQTFEGRALPLSVRFAVAKLEELIRRLRLTSTLRSGRPRPGGVTTGVGHWMGETVPLRAPTAAGNGT